MYHQINTPTFQSQNAVDGEHIESGKRIYAPANYIIITSGNVLSYQTYTCENADVLPIGPNEKTPMQLKSKYNYFHSRKCIRKCWQKADQFVPTPLC